jgi:catechol 2,3-dioxygenase-like lactoylglutathione lyase family enzyme
MKTQWTHLALHVQSAEASIAFYSHCANFRVIDRHSDASSTGMEVVWLSDRSANDQLSFVMVLQEGTPYNLPDAKPQPPLGPISHLGFALASREEVDAVAGEAKKAGLLKFGPTFLNPYAGYLCIVSDPDGHMVEFSHGQALGRADERSDAQPATNQMVGRV